MFGYSILLHASTVDISYRNVGSWCTKRKWRNLFLQTVGLKLW